ncbi:MULTISPECIES: cell division protein ZapE [Shewanella]|uniref:Cell division protein ZapE n=1 Tax=Shewanella holmiensis TaxID=2952222 RepID=A0A9X2WJQ6_9GAMM|nr:MULTISPECIES: cell division protein ZapE [Shewanella]MCT7940671.1 cell division protein ZapE [Shewanella holmiensis]MDP5145664.1 cell division protein ZapE [Shewanella sp. ULN5]
MTLSPLAQYQALTQINVSPDEAQTEALQALDALFQQLHSAEIATHIKGLYLWGDVGRGKTFLMDLFYHSMVNTPKLRLHFHRFMAMVHQRLNQTYGIREPLTYIAKDIAKQYRLICFDEFFVTDIGDAILLARLFDTLFAEGVVLVATSNIPINNLYKGGLQRDRFMPTIGLLKQYTQEIHLNGRIDHRLTAPNKSLNRPASLTAPSMLFTLPSIQTPEEIYALLQHECRFISASCNALQSDHISICQRLIPIRAAMGKLAWFEFNALCDGPRSALDYIELAGKFKAILLSHVPTLGGEIRSWIKARGTEDGAIATVTGERQLAYSIQDDPTRRFISLVDELYDQKVCLIIHSAHPLESLYQNGALSFEFKRTYSRLIEMKRWLAN